MVRPKSGTKEGDLATLRWRETMLKKYGEEKFHEMIRNAGRKGGLLSRGGGFASGKVGADGLTGRQRARVAGEKGGRISRRTGVLNGQGRRRGEDAIDQAERILLEELEDER